MNKESIKLPEATDRVFISQVWTGLCSMQVCVLSDATDEEILEVCNRDNPSGTRGGWSTVINSLEQAKKLGLSGKDGTSAAPGPCADCPGRLHKIVMC